MIHLNKNVKSRYLYYINNIRKKNGRYFLGASLLPFLGLFLVYEGPIPSKPPYSSSITEPVAQVLVVSEEGHNTGSAFLVGRTHLITVRHIIDNLEPGDRVNLLFDKAEPKISTNATLRWKASGRSHDSEKEDFINNDFAVLQLSAPADLPKDFPRMQLGSSAGIEVLANVILAGYPAGYFSISNGTISNIEFQDHDIFQIDVSAWPGSSGGPLIEKETNEVIGVLGGGMVGTFVGINFAYKIDDVLREIRAANINIED